MNDQTQLDPAGAVAWLPPQLSIIVPTFNGNTVAAYRLVP